MTKTNSNKTFSLSAAVFLAAATIATGASAQTAAGDDGGSPAGPRRMRQVEANGRCEGLSYGTGARRCGTRTGGPVGGISGRN